MLTEILLEVTDSGVQGIARSVYNKAKANASKGKFIKPRRNMKNCNLTVTLFYELIGFVYLLMIIKLLLRQNIPRFIQPTLQKNILSFDIKMGLIKNILQDSFFLHVR